MKISEYIGVISIMLIIQCCLISLFEHLGFIMLYGGRTLMNFTIKDTWLILIIFIFGIPNIVVLFVIKKGRLLEE